MTTRGRIILVISILGVGALLIAVFTLMGHLSRAQRYERGVALEQRSDWAAALRVWHELGKYKDARVHWRTASHQLALAQGREAADAGRYRDAVGFFRTAIEYTKTPEAEKALARAQQLLDEQLRERAARLVESAGTARKKRKWADALASYRQAVELDTSLKTRLAGTIAETEKALAAERERERREAELRAEQERKEAERQRLRDIAASMNRYEAEAGSNVDIAVGKVKLTTRVSGDFGYYRYVTGESRFVWVYASARNRGGSITHVNPNDFTLATPGGYTVSHDQTTYMLSNYFDAVDLRHGGETAGWLIFILPKGKEYVLNYQGGLEGRARKRLVAP